MVNTLVKRAIILCAGMGSRLMPYTKDRPKCMVNIYGNSFLERQVRLFRRNNIEEIIVVGGYAADSIKNIDIDHLIINPKYSSTNMVRSLFCAEEFIEDGVIVSYGDIYFSEKILKKLLSSRKQISVVIDKNWKHYWSNRSEEPIEDLETLKLDSFSRIKELGKKPTSINEIEGQYIGLVKYQYDGIIKLKETYHNSLNKRSIQQKKIDEAFMTDLLQEMIDHGVEVSSVQISDPWIEIDSPQDFNSDFSAERIYKLDKLNSFAIKESD